MKKLFPLLLTAMIIMAFSCDQPRYIYNQPLRNLHYFTEKGQSRIGASWAFGPSRNDPGTGNNYNHGFDLQAAYAISSHWALTGGYFQRREQDVLYVSPGISSSSQYEVSYRRNGWEFGGSFFTPFNPRKNAFFYVDAGLGSGTNNLTDNGSINPQQATRYFDNNQFRFYVQPGVYTGKGAVQISAGLRWQLVSYSNINTNYNPIELSDFYLNGLREVQMFEPYVGLRFGHPDLPWVKGDFQASLSVPNTSYFYIRDGYLSFGLIFDPFAKKKKTGL